jgi:ADP-ribose pyrophosphatase
MQWKELGRRLVYDSDWVKLHHLDLQLPDGQVARSWHLIDYPRQAAGVVPVGDDGRILMIDHYRFATKTRSWETPGGVIEPNETGVVAAHRELREETGHDARHIEFLGAYHPSCGSSNQVFNIHLAHGVHKVGKVIDTNEVIDVRWFTASEVHQMIRQNEITEGMTLTGLLWAFLSTGI